MKTLSIIPANSTLMFSCIENGKTTLEKEKFNIYGNTGPKGRILSFIKDKIEAKKNGRKYSPDILCIRVLYGGLSFKKPVLFSPDIYRPLKELIPMAPLHIPLVLSLIDESRTVFPGAEIFLFFETSFFTGLPEREQAYAVDPGAPAWMGWKRYGYHGILHEAAASMGRRLFASAGKSRGAGIMSICLSPRPEATAISGTKPLMVTGGATPLEGIAGDTSCGDIDPGILIKLANECGWGPESINKLLTAESGISGMLGFMVKLDEVFNSNRRDYALIQKYIKYRLLESCGAGIAAVGTLDYIIFSGKYKKTGEILGPWLSEKIKEINGGAAPGWKILPTELDEIMAETSETMLLEQKNDNLLSFAVTI